MKIFDHYYKSRKSEPVFKKKEERVDLQLNIVAGINLATVKFKSTYHESIVNTKFDLGTSFAFGVAADFVLPRNNRKWSFDNELLYVHYKLNGTYEKYINDNNYTIASSTLAYSYIKLNNMFRYKIYSGNFNLFVNAGISNGIAFNEINENTTFVNLYSVETTSKGKFLNDTRRYEQGYLLGFGGIYKIFSFEFRYEHGSGMSDVFTINSQTKRYYFLFGFRLIK